MRIMGLDFGSKTVGFGCNQTTKRLFDKRKNVSEFTSLL